jgi:hypothetical protein
VLSHILSLLLCFCLVNKILGGDFSVFKYQTYNWQLGLYNNEVNSFYVNNSYNKTSLQATVVPEVVRLPQPLTYYKEQFTQSGGFEAMIADARDAARIKGYDVNSFNFDVVAFSYTGLFGGVVGLSTIGSRCLVPECDGVICTTQIIKESLWDKFYTAAPQRLRHFAEQYKIVKKA